MKNITWKPAALDQITESKKYLASYDILRARGTSLPVVHESTIVVAENSTKKVPVTIDQTGVFIIDVTVEASATAELQCLIRAKESDATLTIIHCTLEKGAHLDTSLGIFGGAYTGFFLETTLAGEESSTEERTLFWADGSQIFDLFSTTTHLGRATRSLVSSKGIAHQKAKVRFDGSIHITRDAKGSEAKLLEHTLLLSSEAAMRAIPGLTIDTNDVVANHAASMTRIDDEQIFYCESRGIPEKDAKRIIAEGFIRGGVNNDSLDSLIEEKLCRL